MKFISWNVNGLRACLKKGFEDVFNALDADFFCIQETKMQPGQADFAPAGYTEYIYSADKKGYSGTAIWAKTPALLSVRYGLDEDVHNHEGRAIALEYPVFIWSISTCPTPRTSWRALTTVCSGRTTCAAICKKLDTEKPVILCGDLNVAHEDIDLKNPGPNRGGGFSRPGAASGRPAGCGLPRIPSATCTPTPPACTAGGACASAPVSGTRAGGSTISSSAAAWPIRSRKQRF